MQCNDKHSRVQRNDKHVCYYQSSLFPKCSSGAASGASGSRSRGCYTHAPGSTQFSRRELTLIHCLLSLGCQAWSMKNTDIKAKCFKEWWSRWRENIKQMEHKHERVERCVIQRGFVREGSIAFCFFSGGLMTLQILISYSSFPSLEENSDLCKLLHCLCPSSQKWGTNGWIYRINW